MLDSIIVSIYTKIDNLKQMTYFVDGEGNVCGFDEKVQNYPLVYFTSVNDGVSKYIICRLKDYAYQNAQHPNPNPSIATQSKN